MHIRNLLCPKKRSVWNYFPQKTAYMMVADCPVINGHDSHIKSQFVLAHTLSCGHPRASPHIHLPTHLPIHPTSSSYTQPNGLALKLVCTLRHQALHRGDHLCVQRLASAIAAQIRVDWRWTHWRPRLTPVWCSGGSTVPSPHNQIGLSHWELPSILTSLTLVASERCWRTLRERVNWSHSLWSLSWTLAYNYIYICDCVFTAVCFWMSRALLCCHGYIPAFQEGLCVSDLCEVLRVFLRVRGHVCGQFLQTTIINLFPPKSFVSRSFTNFKPIKMPHTVPMSGSTPYH